MRSIDSFPNHPIDSKPKKSSWDSLSSGSTDWSVLEPVDEFDDGDSFSRHRPLDYPDNWKKPDLPYEAHEVPIQRTNQQTTNQANKSDLIDMPLDADLLEYVNNSNKAGDQNESPRVRTPEKEAGARKSIEDSIKELQELLGKLN